MTLDIGYSCAFDCIVKPRPDLKSTYQDSHFGIFYICVWLRVALLIWNVRLQV